MAQPRPVVMTLMVRDEADIVAAMIEHHLAQGIDLIIATDNGSIDGTREILAEYAKLGVVELHDDPRHEKQQAEVVTAMARRAYTEHNAAWVLNADADEFWFAAAGGTVADALAHVPESVQSFAAPVRNLMGVPLETGSPLTTHVWRDERDEEALHAVGLHAHPTPDCVHRGSADVTVTQGNHATNLPLTPAATLPASAELLVLHLPFRGWDKYEHRVSITAAAYATSELSPSPRHHGMRDARWLEADELRAVFAARHPSPHGGEGFVQDTRLIDALTALVDDGARLPEQLLAALEPGTPLADEAELRAHFLTVAPWLIGEAEQRAMLRYREHDFYELLAKHDALLASLGEPNDPVQAVERLRAQAASAAETNRALTEYLDRLMSNRGVRLAARVFVPRHGWGERKRKLRRTVTAVIGRVRRLVQRVRR